jgi:hypothetical protein
MAENMSSNDSTKNSPSKSEKFLWWCAGADIELLSSSCPPSDRAKYFGMGGVVLATGILAALSSGFGFYTIFGPKGDAVKSTAEGLVNFGEGADILVVVASAIFGVLCVAISGYHGTPSAATSFPLTTLQALLLHTSSSVHSP